MGHEAGIKEGAQVGEDRAFLGELKGVVPLLAGGVGWGVIAVEVVGGDEAEFGLEDKQGTVEVGGEGVVVVFVDEGAHGVERGIEVEVDGFQDRRAGEEMAGWEIVEGRAAKGAVGAKPKGGEDFGGGDGGLVGGEAAKAKGDGGLDLVEFFEEGLKALGIVDKRSEVGVDGEAVGGFGEVAPEGTADLHQEAAAGGRWADGQAFDGGLAGGRELAVVVFGGGELAVVVFGGDDPAQEGEFEAMPDPGIVGVGFVGEELLDGLELCVAQAVGKEEVVQVFVLDHPADVGAGLAGQGAVANDGPDEIERIGGGAGEGMGLVGECALAMFDVPDGGRALVEGVVEAQFFGNAKTCANFVLERFFAEDLVFALPVEDGGDDDRALEVFADGVKTKPGGAAEFREDTDFGAADDLVMKAYGRGVQTLEGVEEPCGGGEDRVFFPPGAEGNHLFWWFVGRLVTRGRSLVVRHDFPEVAEMRGARGSRYQVENVEGIWARRPCSLR